MLSVVLATTVAAIAAEDDAEIEREILSIEIPEEIDATVGTARERFDAREYATAIALADVAIARMESVDRYDARMIEPYILIGDAALELGDLGRALAAYQSGMQLQRMTEGLLTSAQIPLIYRQAQIHLTTGDLASANHLFEYAFQVLSRGSAPRGELISAAFTLGRWYEDMGFPFTARLLYDHVDDELVDESLDPALRVELLVRLSRTYRLARFPLRRRPVEDRSFEPRPFGVRLGESAAYSRTGRNPTARGRGFRVLEEARLIAASTFGEDSQELLAVQLELADWLLLFNDVTAARALYATVFERAVAYPALRRLLAEPVVLATVDPGDPKKMFGQPGSNQGKVTYSVAFDEIGRPRNLTLLARDPEDFDDIRYRRALSQIRFRPPMEEGQLVAGDWEQTYDFLY